MRKKIQQSKRQKNKIRIRILIAVAAVSIVATITGGLLVILNITNQFFGNLEEQLEKYQYTVILVGSILTHHDVNFGDRE